MSTKKDVVQTVMGPIDIDQMGITLMHEHLQIEIEDLWHKPQDVSRQMLVHAPLSLDILGELHYDPFVNLDNLKMTDVDTAVSEVLKFKEAGGQTIVDATSRGNGRNPQALRTIAARTGLNIVMGCGYYMEYCHPREVKDMPIADVADKIVAEVIEGVDGSGIRAGIIGEAGISKDMTPQEVKMLRAQSRAQVRTGLPLTIHLHGWGRQAHQVLDVVAEEGGNLQKVILDHMNPSFDDFEYQASLADRGAYIEYDMVGMDYYYPEIDGQSPSDEENAKAIKGLVDSGYLKNILLSQDVFLKMMLTCYGGFGYAHILRHFVPRLKRHGMIDTQIHTLLVENPQSVFRTKEDIR